jgi:hypothetical protein
VVHLYESRQHLWLGRNGALSMFIYLARSVGRTNAALRALNAALE